MRRLQDTQPIGAPPPLHHLPPRGTVGRAPTPDPRPAPLDALELELLRNQMFDAFIHAVACRIGEDEDGGNL